MRRLLFLLFLAIGITDVAAAPAQYAFRVTFTDKKGAPALSSAPAWLSARSMARRANFGIVLDSTDRPVSPLYVDTVLQLTQGVLHNTSRWLNTCVVLLEDSSRILSLAGKPYVSDVAWVGYFSSGLHLRMTGDNPKYAAERSASSRAKVSGTQAYYNYSWNQTSLVNGDFLHDLGLTGAGKIIAILDEGFTDVDTHYGFDSMRNSGRLLETYNFKRNNTSVFINGTHGTNCLSTMAGFIPNTYVGSAPAAQYALYSTEDGSFTDAIYELDNLIAAVERADSLGADVVSASVVYNIFISPFNTAFTKAQLDGHTTNVARAVNMAVAKGIFYTSSAGNEGGNSWDYLDSPGDADSALTVGAVNASKVVAGFSSPGPNASGRVKPDVCLMGDPATVFGGGGGIMNSAGTSFAAPQAAGYAACLMQAFPKAKPYEIRQAIIRSADSYTSPTAKRGYGVPNFRTVYQYLDIGGPAAEARLLVTPNPFGQLFTIGLPASAVTVKLAMYDVLGARIALNARRNGSSVVASPAESLPPGLYILQALVDGKPYILKLTHY